MEKIIQKAIEGGWDVGYDKKYGQVYTRDNLDSKGNVTGGSILGNHDVVLDPLFWQALGKKCGWYELKISLRDWPEGLNIGEWQDNTWKRHALHFHEINLTTSWDNAVAWLENLITKEHIHISGNMVYTSNPPQYKCIVCGKFFYK